MTSSLFDFDNGARQVRFTPEALEALFSKDSASSDEATVYLIQRDGKRLSAVHQLRPGAIVTFGRVATNDIEVNDARCSRRHSAVYDHEGSWFVRDLGSRNGTRVNGEKISGAVELKRGDQIRIGRTKFIFADDLSAADDAVDSQGTEESSCDESLNGRDSD